MNDDATQGGQDAPADSALRQLRRRYDELRVDYESLLARLTEAEERAEAVAPHEPEPPRFGLLEQLLAPLATLRDEYEQALSDLGRVVGGIDDLLPRGMKGQRVAPALGGEPGRIEVDVRGQGAGVLLAFRERLAGLEGVLSANIHAIDAGRAVIVVELA